MQAGALKGILSQDHPRERPKSWLYDASNTIRKAYANYVGMSWK